MKISFTLLLSLVSSAAHAATGQKPNIIFFLVDDLGWQDCSVPMHSSVTTQNRFFKTPNLEKLAAKGVKFTNAYACPLSSPSRVSLLTGCNATRHHVTNVGNPPAKAAGAGTARQGKDRQNQQSGMRRKGPQQESSPLSVQDWNEQGICTDIQRDNSYLCTTFPQILQKAGYTTMIVGKGHLGKNDCASDMHNLGFDHSVGASTAAGPASYLGSSNFATMNSRMTVPDLQAYHGKDIFLTEALTLESIKLMNGAVAAKKPFFLYMSHFAVHTPHDKDNRFYDKYIKAGASETEAAYASLVEGVDKSLGDLLSYLDENGIADKTIVIFMSDNGGQSRGMPRDNRGKAGPNAPLRATKSSLYEGGIREPMVAYVPNLTKAGTTNNSTIIMEDFHPTIVQLAGATELAKGSTQSSDSYSFVKALGGAHINASRPFYWHYPHQKRGEDGMVVSEVGRASSAIRLGNMKLIHFYLTGKSELYDLSKDIGESHNLIGTSEAHTATAARLATMLSNKLKAEKSELPVNISTGKTCLYPDGTAEE